MRSDQIFEMPSAPNVERVWIEGTDADHKADEVISDVVNIAESWLAKIPKEASSG
jgi:predicted site-specific integrase-resolvase